MDTVIGIGLIAFAAALLGAALGVLAVIRWMEKGLGR